MKIELSSGFRECDTDFCDSMCPTSMIANKHVFFWIMLDILIFVLKSWSDFLSAARACTLFKDFLEKMFFVKTIILRRFWGNDAFCVIKSYFAGLKKVLDFG